MRLNTAVPSANKIPPANEMGKTKTKPAIPNEPANRRADGLLSTRRAADQAARPTQKRARLRPNSDVALGDSAGRPKAHHQAGHRHQAQDGDRRLPTTRR